MISNNAIIKILAILLTIFIILFIVFIALWLSEKSGTTSPDVLGSRFSVIYPDAYIVDEYKHYIEATPNVRVSLWPGVIYAKGPVSFSSKDIPNWLSIDNKTGAIAGMSNVFDATMKYFTIVASDTQYKRSIKIYYNVTALFKIDAVVSYDQTLTLVRDNAIDNLSVISNGVATAEWKPDNGVDGLTIGDASTGFAISGTPTTAAPTKKYIILVTDTDGTQTEKYFKIQVLDTMPTPRYEVDMKEVIVGNSYRIQVDPASITGLENGNYNWSDGSRIDSATSTLDPYTGEIYGVISPDEKPGTLTFSVYCATDIFKTPPFTTNLQIVQSPPQWIGYADSSDTPIPNPYSIPVNVAMGEIHPTFQEPVGNYIFSVGPALPMGMNLDPATGFISGTPDVAVPFTDYIITATTNDNSLTAEYVLKMETKEGIPLVGYAESSAPDVPLIQNPKVPYIIVQNIPISLIPIISGESISGLVYTADSLPTDISIDQSNGEIKGYCSTETGPKQTQVTATLESEARVGITTIFFDIQVAKIAYAPPLTNYTVGSEITPLALDLAKCVLPSIGTTTYQLGTRGDLHGLVLDENTGTISGQPKTATEADVTVTIEMRNSENAEGADARLASTDITFTITNVLPLRTRQTTQRSTATDLYI